MPRFRSLLLPALAIVTACSGEPPTAPITALPRPLTQAEGALVEVGNRFTFSLFRETLRQQPATANVFISPLSVGMALGMTLNGAAGQTETEMRSALGLGDLTREEINDSYRSLIDLLSGLDPSTTFTIANSIWHRNTFQMLPEFLETNRTAFDAEIRALDFNAPQASATINGWVNERTAGRIPEIVPTPLPQLAVIYLINAIYFKASWATRFDPARTQPMPFQLAGGGTVSVPGMTHGEPAPVRMTSDAIAEVLDLPYGGGAYSMTIVLPRHGVPIDSVVQRLTRDTWERWIAGLDSGKIDVFLPRFTLRYDLEPIIEVLKALGMPGAFCDAPQFPDFTRMDPQGEVCISNVKHKTFVLVDEEGTEAAAATSVEGGLTSAPPVFMVNRPFLFAIRERFSGTVLFIGRVMNPAA